MTIISYNFDIVIIELVWGKYVISNIKVPKPSILWGPLGNPTPFKMFSYLFSPSSCPNLFFYLAS